MVKVYKGFVRLNPAGCILREQYWLTHFFTVSYAETFPFSIENEKNGTGVHLTIKFNHYRI